jgi:hypothetical protein
MANENENGTQGGFDVAGLIPQITEEVTAALRDRAIQNFSYSVTNAVGEQVSKYIQENVVPLVAVELKSRDAEVRAAVAAAFIASVDALAENLKATAIKKMAGYDGDKLVSEFVRAVFGRGY